MFNKYFLNKVMNDCQMIWIRTQGKCEMSLRISHVLCLSIPNSILFPFAQLSVSLKFPLVLLGKKAGLPTANLSLRRTHSSQQKPQNSKAQQTQSKWPELESRKTTWLKMNISLELGTRKICRQLHQLCFPGASSLGSTCSVQKYEDIGLYQ